MRAMSDQYLSPELYRTELRMLFRDRRTILVSIVLPAILMPALIFGSARISELREKSIASDSCVVILTGSAPDSVMDAVGRSISAPGAIPLSVERMDSPDERILDSDSVQTIVSASTGRRPVPSVVVHYREDLDRSRLAADLVLERLFALRDSVRQAILAGRGASWMNDSSFVDVRDTSSPEASYGYGVGTMAMLFVMAFLLSGVSVAALDSIAGDRERGSLETLLASGVGRTAVAGSKLAAACTVGLVSVLVQAASFLVIERTGLLGDMFPGRITGSSGTYLLILLQVLPSAVFAGSIVLYASAASATFRQAQLKLFPVLIAGVLPTLSTLFPGLEGRGLITAVPVAGLALCLRDTLSGRPDLPWILAAAGSTLAASALISRGVVAAISREDILSPAADPIPCPALLARRAFLYSGIVWAVSVISSVQLERVADIRTVLLVNQLGILLLPALYAAVRFRLPGTGVLRLRVPGLLPLLVTIPCAAAGLILTTGLFELVSNILPTGGRAVQSFGDALLPGATSLPELLLLYCVLPGVVEEFVFRGVLMGSLGLRRGWGPAGAIVASAVVFGMFHFLYFRIIPTAVIGVMAGVAVVRSGSLVTGMIWHASSNALALLASHPSLDIGFRVDPATLPAAAYPAAFAVVFLGLLLMKPPLRQG